MEESWVRSMVPYSYELVSTLLCFFRLLCPLFCVGFNCTIKTDRCCPVLLLLQNNITLKMPSNNNKRSRRRTAAGAATTTTTILSLVAWMLSSNVTPADCFARTTAAYAPPIASSSTTSTTSSSTLTVERTKSLALNFRDTRLEGVTTTVSFTPPIVSAASTLVSSSSSTSTISTSPASLFDNHHDINNSNTMLLPTWLRIPRSHLWQHNLQRLETAMRSCSYFTPSEVAGVIVVIQDAANGDKSQIAGAADFLLILVETMEMGYNALVAAAFHYCSCVTARQQGGLGNLALLEHEQTESFGEHVVSISRDAARLKHLENVAAAVMDTQGVARVSPNSADAENIRNLLLSETNDWRALAIRSAACLYRLRGLLQAGNNSQQQRLTRERARTAREALYIYAPLASRLGMNRLKNELEGAAFRILYRRQYEKVKQLTHEHCKSSSDSVDPFSSSTSDSTAATIGQSMRRVLDQVKDDMTAMLQHNKEFSSRVKNLKVTARVKESYSMWRKMLAHGYKHIFDVPDALALRIVFDAVADGGGDDNDDEPEPREVTRARERALCYYAQQLCTERYKPVANNPRFKDYIERPKANGYQSLHYTAHAGCGDDGGDWNLEIQVRSSEMHQVAEFGLASHWDYKAQKKTASTEGSSSSSTTKASSSSSSFADTDNLDRSSEAYLKKVEQWHWEQHAEPLAAKRKAAFVTASLNDASPTLYEPVVFSELWQSRSRADRIRARTQRLEPYIQALTTAQSDLARDFVFVFLKPPSLSGEGKVLALPAGACVVDALREGERSLGVPMLFGDTFNLNGASTSVTSRLSNGDVLTVPLRAGVTVSA
jgi:(p)ppGpp synthase/HD superfamily hydrolase